MNKDLGSKRFRWMGHYYLAVGAWCGGGTLLFFGVGGAARVLTIYVILICTIAAAIYAPYQLRYDSALNRLGSWYFGWRHAVDLSNISACVYNGKENTGSKLSAFRLRDRTGNRLVVYRHGFRAIPLDP